MYLLTMYQKLMFGPLDKPENNDAVKDIHGREPWVFGIVVVAALVMGLVPAADPRPLREVGRGVHRQLPRSPAGRAARARGAGARLPAPLAAAPAPAARATAPRPEARREASTSTSCSLTRRC